MIFDEFDRKTMANMEVALERVCQLYPDRLARHDARALVAAAILESARSGRTNLGQLTLAARQAVSRLRSTAPLHSKSRERLS